MTITITVFERAFDEGRGLARDMRVRWALEEVGQTYEVRPVPWEGFREAAHLARNPFGQIPTYEEGDLTLFESGAIVFHVAQKFPGLLPADADARARAIMWMFAAIGAVEPPIVDRDIVEYAERDRDWQGERFAMVDARIRGRLSELAASLADKPWLDGDFSAADIIMVHVLRRLEGGPILAEFPSLTAYIARAEARPAYQRAFAAQLALWEANKG
ncbi:MAG: glutathione S-transferase family protein [Hyphomonadaceae bacterium]|nr:glutathione S-transferase family protein [Hyphomonadaceae bacterium]